MRKWADGAHNIVRYIIKGLHDKNAVSDHQISKVKMNFDFKDIKIGKSLRLWILMQNINQLNNICTGLRNQIRPALDCDAVYNVLNDTSK